MKSDLNIIPLTVWYHRGLTETIFGYCTCIHDRWISLMDSLCRDRVTVWNGSLINWMFLVLFCFLFVKARKVTCLVSTVPKKDINYFLESPGSKLSSLRLCSLTCLSSYFWVSLAQRMHETWNSQNCQLASISRVPDSCTYPLVSRLTH